MATKGDHARPKFQGGRTATTPKGNVVDLMKLDLNDPDDQKKALRALKEAKAELLYS